MSERTFNTLRSHLYNVACHYWVLLFIAFCLRKFLNICIESINSNLHPDAVFV